MGGSVLLLKAVLLLLLLLLLPLPLPLPLPLSPPLLLPPPLPLLFPQLTLPAKYRSPIEKDTAADTSLVQWSWFLEHRKALVRLQFLIGHRQDTAYSKTFRTPPQTKTPNPFRNHRMGLLKTLLKTNRSRSGADPVSKGLFPLARLQFLIGYTGKWQV